MSHDGRDFPTVEGSDDGLHLGFLVVATDLRVGHRVQIMDQKDIVGWVTGIAVYARSIDVQVSWWNDRTLATQWLDVSLLKRLPADHKSAKMGLAPNG